MFALNVVLLPTIKFVVAVNDVEFITAFTVELPIITELEAKRVPIEIVAGGSGTIIAVGYSFIFILNGKLPRLDMRLSYLVTEGVTVTIPSTTLVITPVLILESSQSQTYWPDTRALVFEEFIVI